MQIIPIVLLLVLVLGAAVACDVDPVGNLGTGVQELIDVVDALDNSDAVG
jgi:hypothetical protein